MKRLAFYALIVAATVALLILFWQFRSVVILLILSLVLTAALRPSVEFLEARGLRAPLARLIVYMLVFGLLGLALWFVSGPLLAELQLLTNFLIVVYDSLYQAWSSGTGLQQAIAGRLPAADQLGELLGGASGASALQLLFGVTQNAATVVAGILIIVVLSLYWSADRAHFERLWLSVLPANRRIQARSIWQTTETTLGAYLRSEIIQAVLAVVLLAFGYQIIQLDYPILTALLVGFAWLVPVAGFFFAAVFAFLMGLASAQGYLLAIGATALTAAVLAFLEFVVEPRIYRRSQFSGVWTIVMILIMVDAYGLIGFVVAPPLAVALQVLVSHIVAAIRRSPTTAIQIDTLQERLVGVSQLYNGQGPDEEAAAMPPEIASVQKRLGDLIGEARKVATEG
jgi:predicted PurR-regulated permease PerM